MIGCKRATTTTTNTMDISYYNNLDKRYSLTIEHRIIIIIIESPSSNSNINDKERVKNAGTESWVRGDNNIHGPWI